MPTAAELDCTINLLTPARLETLLGWANSHVRKFSESAQSHAIENWRSTFAKDESYQALSELLMLPGGREAAEAICQRAKIKGLKEAIDLRAKQAMLTLHGSSRLPVNSAWPRLLAEAGNSVEAAWLFWWNHGVPGDGATEEWLAKSQDVVALFGQAPVGSAPDDPPENVLPEDDRDTFLHIRNDILEWLDGAEGDAASFAALLRGAVDRLDALAAEEERVHVLAQKRVGLVAALAEYRSAIAAANGDTTGATVEKLAAVQDWEGWPIAAIEQLLASLPDYIAAAQTWRTAMDLLAETHDYQGVGAAHLAEKALHERIDALLTYSPTKEPPAEGGPAEDMDAVIAVPDVAAQPTEHPDDPVESRAPAMAPNAEDLPLVDAVPISPEEPAFEIAAEQPLIDPFVDEVDLIDAAQGGSAESKARAQHALRASASAFAEGRYGLAVHIAAVAEMGGETPPLGFGSGILRALGTGLAVGTGGGTRSAEAFSHARARVEDALGPDAEQPIRLLAFAGALRPALFAISSGADHVLRLLSGLQSMAPATHGLALFAANNVRSGDIVPAELAAVGNEMAPRRAFDALRADTERFLAAAFRRTIKFQPATAIWINVLRSAPVHDALQAIIADAPNAAVAVGRALDTTLSDIDRLITDRDREGLAGRKREPLTAKPRATLRDWLEDVAARLKTWQSLNAALQNSAHNRFDVERRQELKTRLETASAELDLLDVHGDPALNVARDASRQAIATILDLFRGQSDPRPVSGEEELLLFEPPVMIEEAERWTDAERSAFLIAAEQIASSPPDFEAALKTALDHGRFGRAALLREKIVASNPERDEPLERMIRGALDTQLTTARSRLSKMRTRLNELLGADDRETLSRDLSPSLDELETQIEHSDRAINLAEWWQALNCIEAELDTGFHALLGPLQHEVDTLENSGRNVSALRKMIDLRDLATLSENIEAYKQGAMPPSAATDLLESFNAHVQNVTRRIDLPALEHAITTRGELDGVDFSRWDDSEIETTRSLLKAWRELKENEGNQSPPQLRAMFQALFAATSIDVVINKNQEVPGHYQLRTPTFTTRAECVVPAFGSEAKGRYEVVLVDRRGIGSGVELATLKSKLNGPAFFVIRAAIPGAARKAFMQRVRLAGAAPACGLIDEATIMFLAMRRGWQRSDVFGLALAYGVVQPYSDTAQKTSPEMFFGRHDELRELWDPNGSCLVYGGRQLGKTALLRQIELRNDRPDQIVEYGDDDVDEFTRQGSAGFWRWIGTRAEARGIPMPSKRSGSDVQQAIRDWLQADVTRRLLFLIDEADKFLRSELRSGFKMLLQLRELMRVTDRRCKFIFAGLHDVQRLARTPNSPLLHFGTPIRVGPLMGKDLFEARDMVEQPMAAAGYAFGVDVEEGRALMGRALSEVGYYPSLMQTLGMVLVNRMNARAVSSIAGEPPHLPIRVGGEELSAALEDSAFRNNVRDKFNKTLDLDPRYRLIAYLVMIGTQKTANRQDMRPGMSIAAIQKEAMFWWAQGFVEDSSNSAFEGLLKEMEGLGVLVGLNDGRFAIRSARIAAMLGSVSEVEDRIEELAQQPYEVVDDTGSLRRALGRAPSPLTFRQEAVLMEQRNTSPVTVVLTSTALGLDLMPSAVQELTRSDEALLVVVPPGPIDTLSQLDRAITAVAGRTKEAGRQRGLLIASGRWLGKDAVAAALEHPEVRRAKRLSNQGREQGVRVILLPSMVDWRELGNEEQGDRLWGAMLMSLTPLHDASLREWFERRVDSRTLPGGAIEKLRNATGGFPEILSRLTGDTAGQILASAEAENALILADRDKALATVGLDAGWLRQVGEFLLDQCDGVISVNDQESIVDLMHDEGLREGDRALRVLGYLGVFDRTMDRDLLSGWKLNPFVAQLLGSRASA